MFLENIKTPHALTFQCLQFLQCTHATNITVSDTATRDHPVHRVGGETVNKPSEGGGDVA